MHFKFETKALDDVLSRIGKVIPSAEYVQFVGKDKKVRVITSHEGFSVSVELPCTLMADGKFAVAFDDIKKLFRNRKEIEMKLAEKGNKVMFKAGSSKDFSGDVVTVETHAIKFGDLENAVKLSKNQSDFLCASIGSLALDDIYFKKSLPLTAYFNSKGAYCFVNSDFHVAVARMKGKFEDSTLTLPMKNFVAIVNLSGKEPFSISVTDSSIQTSGKTFDALFPLESQEESQVKEIFKVVESILNMEPVAVVEMSELKSTMDNVTAVDDGKKSMEVHVTKKEGIHVELSALRGSVKAKLKDAKVSKDAGPFNVSPKLLSNILKNAKKGAFALRVSDRLFSFSSKGDVSYHYIGTFYE